jgi:hypothetical protein
MDGLSLSALHDMRVWQAAQMTDHELAAWLRALIPTLDDELAPLISEATNRLAGRTTIRSVA